MRRKRLEKIRDRLRELRRADPTSETDHDRPMTDEAMLCRSAKDLPGIDTFDFETFHAECGGHAAGCIAGVVICLYPTDAAREYEKHVRNRESRRVDRHLPDVIAQRVLGLDDREGDQLFLASDENCPYNKTPITAEEATTAVERLLAGVDAESIWEHRNAGDCETCEPAENTEDTAGRTLGEHDARDFLDRRDETRISHRLGRPFRF